MPKLVNLGSLCIDHVYRVPTIAGPGESMASRSHDVFVGGKGRMPTALMRVFAPPRDGLSKRTSGKLPADYDAAFSAFEPQPFDRQNGYDRSWLRFDEFDIYGNPRKPV